ncbi:MAG: ABC transporter substrate-binding protein, partial [Bryobacteraceae bacterium]
AAAPGLDFIYPEEGFGLYCDNAVVLKESGRAELAHRFIDYLLRADVAADIVKATRTASPNGAALALLPEELRTSPTLYPAAAVLRRGEWFAPLPAEAQRVRDRMWTEIKSS